MKEMVYERMGDQLIGINGAHWMLYSKSMEYDYAYCHRFDALRKTAEIWYAKEAKYSWRKKTNPGGKGDGSRQTPTLQYKQKQSHSLTEGLSIAQEMKQTGDNLVQLLKSRASRPRSLKLDQIKNQREVTTQQRLDHMATRTRDQGFQSNKTRI